jgi:hypothetical protein
MRIPIDRYKILGVSIGADSHNILNQLEKKLELCEYTGFGIETMSKREGILKETSSILLDKTTRRVYEEEYIKNTGEGLNEPATTIQRGCEIAGLLLLLEAGENQECLAMSEQLYHEKRMSLNYFSSEYKELNRIIDYATLGLAEELQCKRHYETAAAVLERRVRSQSVGMGEKEMINLMSDELKQLLPFRVLDMLSRDNDDKSHEQGISLLKELVNQRGGLDIRSNEYMGSSEFHAFFRQIRKYLTVQEQIELFEKWSDEGSKAGRFLHCIALVAQGFSQRKPNRIYESLRRIEEIRSNELEPVIANMHLLLGDVENADRIFKLYADDQLKAWSTIKTKDPLGALCDWCREWLKRDVLNGYRDIDIEPDIESYFSDNDVVRYIEKKDIYAQSTDYSTKNNAKDSGSNKDNIAKEVNKIAKVKNQGREKELKGKWRKILAYNKDLVSNTSLGGLLKENIAVIGIVAVSICSLWLFTRINGRVNEKRASAPQVLVEREKVPNIEKVSKLEMIKEVLNEWHKVKKEALIENKIPMRANTIATPELLNNLKYETRENMRRGQNQTITVRIKDITMIYETENRVRIVAKLEYSDETRDDSGKVVGRTNEHTFMRKYNFIWDGRKWLIDK